MQSGEPLLWLGEGDLRVPGDLSSPWSTRYFLLTARTLAWYEDSQRTALLDVVALEGAQLMLSSPKAHEAIEPGFLLVELDWGSDSFLPMRLRVPLEAHDAILVSAARFALRAGRWKFLIFKLCPPLL
jgi:hypothetical protein